MNKIDLRRVDLNLLVVFDVLMAEGSVTRAAARLGRTQSALSHSLARLREQVGDPLMVKVGGRMTASPFAERMIEDVRSILRNIQRVLAPSPPFDPASSTRAFRIAVSDIAPTLFPRVLAQVRRQAPGVAVDWIAEGPQTLAAVADGQVDVAFVASGLPLPDGVQSAEAGAIPWASFLHARHPALGSWGAKAWSSWPHVVVQIDNSLRSPVLEADEGAGKRFIAARVLNFAAVAPLLAATDLIATLPVVAMHEALARHGLRAVAPPFAVPPMPHRFVWSARLGNDAGLRWLRGLLVDTFAQILREAAAMPVRRGPSRAAPSRPARPRTSPAKRRPPARPRGRSA